MKIILIIFTLMNSRICLSTCGIGPKGHHVVGGETFFGKNGHEYLNFNFIDPYFYISAPYKKPFDLKSFLVTGEEACVKIETAQKVVDEKYLQVLGCSQYIPRPYSGLGLARFAKDTGEIVIPKYLAGTKLTLKNKESETIEQNILKFVNKSSMKLSTMSTFTAGSYKAVEYIHYKFTNDFFSSSVKFEHESKMVFYAVFITQKDETMYVADSGGLFRCEWNGNKRSENDATETFAIPLEIKTAWDYDNDGIPEIVNFGESNMFYLVEFPHQLRPVHNGFYDGVTTYSNGYPAFGFKPMLTKKAGNLEFQDGKSYAICGKDNGIGLYDKVNGSIVRKAPFCFEATATLNNTDVIIGKVENVDDEWLKVVLDTKEYEPSPAEQTLFVKKQGLTTPFVLTDGKNIIPLSFGGLDKITLKKNNFEEEGELNPCFGTLNPEFLKLEVDPDRIDYKGNLYPEGFDLGKAHLLKYFPSEILTNCGT